jgi:CDP-4-dehydro-6-deoxyglucose reductase, E3
MQALVKSLEPRGGSVVILRLAPLGMRFNYREGQYLSITLPGTTERRSYSMATPCRADGMLELHIRLHEHGLFSRMLGGRIVAGSVLTLSGPYGDCVWRVPPDEDAKVILLATGTGIAPLKAMVERHIRSTARNDVWLYWGVDCPGDLYAANALHALERECMHFHFVPVMRADHPDWAWARGYVQDVASAAHADLDNAYVFACGSPAMVRMARERFVSERGLSNARFFFDAFEPSVQRSVEASGAAPIQEKQEKGEAVSVSVSLPDGAVQTVHCEVGHSLMQALAAENFVQAICGGNQSCGTCRVTFDDEDFAHLPVMSRTEKRLLGALPASGPFDRLACQVEVQNVHEGLHVTVPPRDF